MHLICKPFLANKCVHGMVLQMLVSILSNNCSRFLIVLYTVTVLLEYLTDCSIKVSQFWTNFCGGSMCFPLDPPLLCLRLHQLEIQNGNCIQCCILARTVIRLLIYPNTTVTVTLHTVRR